MIFTECPNCNEPQVFGYEAGDQTGWIPSKCCKCNEVMWVEMTSLGGETLSHSEFKRTIALVEDFGAIDEAAKTAENFSNVVYEK